MPPELQKLQSDVEQLRLILTQHQHQGFDFSPSLRGQDWQQIGKTVLAAAATSIRVDIPQKQFLRILIQWGAKSAGSDDYLRFNNDSAGNYTFINSGGTARTSQTQIDIRDALNSALGGFAVIDIVNNLSSIVKPVIVHVANRITSAGTAQTFYQIFGTWVNTANFITRIDLVSSGAATFPANSSILVLSSKE